MPRKKTGEMMPLNDANQASTRLVFMSEKNAKFLLDFRIFSVM